jgi:DNA-binding NarL/FixJ family response regulator
VTSVVVADDHEVARRGLHALLSEAPGVFVVGEAADGEEAVALVEKMDPDLAILDITMPRMSGLEACRRIRVRCPGTEVLILTVHDADQVVREVRAAGALGFVLKSEAGRHIFEAVKALAQHRPYYSRRVAGATQALAALPPTEELTPREREVLRLIGEGRTTRDVANELGIALKTAEAHRTHLMHKLGARSTSDLVHYAIRTLLVD